MAHLRELLECFPGIKVVNVTEITVALDSPYSCSPVPEKQFIVDTVLRGVKFEFLKAQEVFFGNTLIVLSSSMYAINTSQEPKSPVD